VGEGKKDDGDSNTEQGFVKKCDSFKCLGSVVTDFGACDRDIQNRISVSKNGN
jgi:hypothetical protein